MLPLLIRKYSQPEQIIKSENISAIVQDLKYFRTYAVPLYMAQKFVIFKILTLQLVPLRKS